MKKESVLLLVTMLGLNTVVVSGQEQNISNTEQTTVTGVEESTVATEDDNAYTKIVAIGDSNFQGLKDTNTGPQDNYNQPLPNIIGEGLGVEDVENNSIAGSTISSNKNYENYEPMVERISQLSKDADLVLLQGGINDWKNGIPLGEFGSTDTDDFYGALDKYYGTAKEIYSDADILAFTVTDTTWGRVVDDGVTLEQWADAQIQVAGKYEIPIYDLLRESGFDPKTMSADGLHYNQDVANEIGTGIITKLENDERFRVYEETTTLETTEEIGEESTETPIETTEEIGEESTETPIETTEEIEVEITETPIETTKELEVESTEEPIETTEETEVENMEETEVENEIVKGRGKILNTGNGVRLLTLVLPFIGLPLIGFKKIK